ncbi:MAG: biotin--[acetyl-CoA-carboxylase] ligase [Methylophilaceae bacterium]|nr:biotin--[acetyl-CoA-carboxylase] ligase [Methylophilaceae bacterium]
MHNLTFPILRLLADAKFRSGAAIARHFQVSRTTVWNALQEAEALGVEVYSVRGKGYRLPEPLSLLDKDEILATLGEKRHIFELQVHDQLASTNSFLMQASSQGAPHATCVAAELQTAGRGRRGRVWQAGLGASLTFSLLWRFQCGASALSGLSLAVGLALVRALHEYGLPGAQLKWPNDLLVLHENKYHKLAGILIELQGDMEGPSTAIIGIGINLHLPNNLIHTIDQPATDMHTLLNATINPNQLLGLLLKHLAEILTEFEHKGFESLRTEWVQYHAYHNQPVRLIAPDGSETIVKVSGIATDGTLLVETPTGLQRVLSGEISLRGV